MVVIMDDPEIIVESLDLLEGSIRVIEDIINNAPIQSIFDIFHVDTVDMETRDFSLRISEAGNDLSRIHSSIHGDSLSREVVSVRVKSAEKRLSQLRRSVAERQKSARQAQQSEARGIDNDECCEGVTTRSRGQVTIFPHIMPRALEYDVAN